MKRVLFLCTENSARSQIAEAVLNAKGKGQFVSYSAGSRPASDISPYARLIMEEIGEDASNYVPKSAEKFLDQEFDFIITLCDKMKNECPVMSNNAIYVHWGISDPKDFKGTEEEVMKQFRRIRNELVSRINLLLSLPIDKLDNVSLKKKLSEIIDTDSAY